MSRQPDQFFVDLKIWYAVAAASLLFHILGLVAIGRKGIPRQVPLEKVKISVSPAREIPPPPPPPEPKPKEKPKKPPKQTPTPHEQALPAKPDAAPIQGLTKDSVSDKGTMSAPVGNTMMMEDTGKRVAPEDVGALKGDLSSPAALIRDSIQSPPYTDQALDAALEGSWVVDVYVDVSGAVTSAELRKRIGYGMDERVLKVARSARFSPRKNKLGIAEAGWAEIKFTLVIP